jgi:hypothetical protein
MINSLYYTQQYHKTLTDIIINGDRHILFILFVSASGLLFIYLNPLLHSLRALTQIKLGMRMSFL